MIKCTMILWLSFFSWKIFLIQIIWGKFLYKMKDLSQRKKYWPIFGTGFWDHLSYNYVVNLKEIKKYFFFQKKNIWSLVLILTLIPTFNKAIKYFIKYACCILFSEIKTRLFILTFKINKQLNKNNYNWHLGLWYIS